ncbi:hypothetical protein GF325_03665, partial [Candidatus Bathyarchaeota archaeon]|nr:hypothetical protein [Candidatus Bathyarchaeota archaeon]
MMASTRTKISLILGIIALGAVTVTIFTWNEIRDSRIKVGFSLSNLGHIPVQYADNNNLYRQAGIDAKFIEYENDVELANALNQGKIDIAYCSIVPLIQIHASAGPGNAGFVVVAGASVNGSAIMVNEFSGIENPLGLNGTNISIPVAGGLHELLLHEYLNGTLDVGLDILNNETDDVNVSVLQAGDMPFSINGTSNPPFNAFVSWEIVCSVVTSGGFTGKYLVESGSILENHTGDVIACSQEIMDNPRLRDMM